MHCFRRQKKRLTDCVRRRVWSRTVSLPPGGGGGGGGGTNAAQYSTAPGEAGPRTFTVAAKFAGAISSRWTESSGAPFAAVGAVRGTGGGASGGAFPGGWAVVDAGKLFLMAVADSPQVCARARACVCVLEAAFVVYAMCLRVSGELVWR